MPASLPPSLPLSSMVEVGDHVEGGGGGGEERGCEV